MSSEEIQQKVEKMTEEALKSDVPKITADDLEKKKKQEEIRLNQLEQSK